MKTNSQPQIILGGFSTPPLTEQLKGYLPKSKLKTLEGHNIAIKRLRVHGLLPAGETEKARARLKKQIQSEIEQAARGKEGSR